MEAPLDIPKHLAQALLSSRADAVIATDTAGAITFWSPGAERIFGYSADFALGKSLDIIIPERLRARHWHGFRRAMEAGSSRYGEADLLAAPGMRKDGAAISVEFTVAFIKDDGGRIVGIAAVMRDVTARFEEMRALRRKLSTPPQS
jgi:PAS domain S-box-containing protein